MQTFKMRSGQVVTSSFFIFFCLRNSLAKGTVSVPTLVDERQNSSRKVALERGQSAFETSPFVAEYNCPKCKKK